jgi:hypothetical protein
MLPLSALSFYIYCVAARGSAYVSCRGWGVQSEANAGIFKGTVYCPAIQTRWGGGGRVGSFDPL